MDKLVKEFLGGLDKPQTASAPPASGLAATTAAAVTVATATAAPVDSDRRRRRDGFVARYTTGDPREGFTAEEAIAHLREIRAELSPAEFHAALRRTIEHLPVDQREELVAILRQSKGAAPTAAASAGADLLGGLLSGLMGAAGPARSPGLDDLLDSLTKSGQRESPLVRAVLGGIAAFGMQTMPRDSAAAQPAAMEETQRQAATAAPQEAAPEAPPPVAMEPTQQPTAETPQEGATETSQQPATEAEAPQTALTVALAHEQTAYATYQESKAAGNTLNEWEARDRWQAAQQLVQAIQRRSAEASPDFGQTLATALAQEEATFATYRAIKATGNTLNEWEAKDRWESAAQLVQAILAR